MTNITISKEDLKQIVLVTIMGICLFIAILVIKWANQPERRPLIQDIQVVDAVKIVDVLEMSNISYVTRLESKMILVNNEDMDRARLALARVGFVIEYPDIKEMTSNEACNSLAAKLEQPANTVFKPLYQQPWFLRMVKLGMGALVIIVLIVAVVRPVLAAFLHGKPNDNIEP